MVARRKLTQKEWADQVAEKRRLQEAEARKIAQQRLPLTPDQAAAVAKTRIMIERGRAQAQRSRRSIDQHTLELRSLGLSWDRIAGALGTSRQGAMKRHAAALARRDQQEHNR